MGEKNKFYIIKSGKIYDKNNQQIFSIYKWTNIENGMVYFGKTTRDPRIRKAEHLTEVFSKKKKSNNYYLYNAMALYSKEKFKFEVIFQCKSFDVLNTAEIYFIALNKSNDKKFGYNLSAGGDGGGITSEETKLKLSLALKGRKNPRTKEHNENHRNSIIAFYAENDSPMLGVPKSEEHKEKLRISNTGKHIGEKNSFYGKKHTNEILLSQAMFKTQEEIDNLEKLKHDGYTQKELAKMFNCDQGVMTKVFKRRGIYNIFK